MANITQFIPALWAARFLSHLDNALVWGMVANRNYEGEVAEAGDTVKIPTSTTAITVRDYTVDTDIAAPETVSGSTQDLVIDKQKYFNFYVDDIDRAQSRPSIMDDAMGRAAFNMANQVDDDLRGMVDSEYAAGRLVSAITEEVGAAGSALIKAFASAKRRLATSRVIMLGTPWAVIHPDTVNILEEYFLVNPPAGLFVPATAEQALRNGFVGNLLGFQLYTTNKVPAGTAQGSDSTRRIYLSAGTEAITLVDQIVSTEAYRPEKRFGEAVKGLNVYGIKVVRPEALFTIEHKAY